MSNFPDQVSSTPAASSDVDPSAPSGEASKDPTGVIVVGVDGSAPFSEALRWAADEARRRGATLRVVMAWGIPPGALYPGLMPEELFTRIPDETRARLDVQIVDVLGEHPDVAIERLVGEGPAARLILDHAEDATLVVVGSRGHGGFTGLLMGSTSSQVAHHAPCPVTVVRGHRD